jgi:hypothetical protein
VLTKPGSTRTFAQAESLLHISGHASEFVGFLCDELLPLIDATYRTRACRARALIGKSFGGSGVGAALIDARAAAFSEFVLGSPSLAWDDGAWFRLEAEARRMAAASPEYASRGSPPYAASVFCCIGAEKDVNEELIRRFKETLDARAGPRGEVKVEVVPGETHGTVSYPFVSKALDWLAARPGWGDE